MAKPVLGRGLGALLGGAEVPAPAGDNVFQPPPPAGAQAREQVQRAAVDRLRPCPLQPRKDFSPESLRELADSIKEQGIVQPLIVRQRGEEFRIDRRGTALARGPDARSGRGAGHRAPGR